VHVRGASGYPTVDGVFYLTSNPPNGIQVWGLVTGLIPGTTHGFHVHYFGDFTAMDASMAGTHYNPGNTSHGLPGQVQYHFGDFGNFFFALNNYGYIDHVTMPQLTYANMYQLIGRGLVVHINQDQGFASHDPTGLSGARIAMGVVGVTDVFPVSLLPGGNTGFMQTPSMLWTVIGAAILIAVRM